jgi:hypothetical protein
LAVGLLSALSAAAVVSADSKGAKDPLAPTCGEYGTTVQFEKTPTDAAKKALKEENLVLVLHVSGDFENPEFT